jgi:hypothetical protein
LDAPSEPPVARPGSRAQPFSDEYGKRDFLGFQAVNWCTA